MADEPIKFATRGKPAQEMSVEIVQRILGVLEEYPGTSVTLAVGCLELAKHELITNYST